MSIGYYCVDCGINFRIPAQHISGTASWDVCPNCGSLNYASNCQDSVGTFTAAPPSTIPSDIAVRDRAERLQIRCAFISSGKYADNENLDRETEKQWTDHNDYEDKHNA